MFKSFALISFALLFGLSMFGFLTSCSPVDPVPPTRVGAARTNANSPIGYFVGTWIQTGFYASTAPQRKSIYESSFGCTLNKRYLHFFDDRVGNDYVGRCKLINNDGCRNSFPIAGQPRVEFLAVGNQSGENVSYSYAANVYANQGGLLTIKRQGNGYSIEKRYKATYPTSTELYVEELNDDGSDPTFLGTYRRLEWYDDVPNVN